MRQIEYKTIDGPIYEKIVGMYGEWTKQYIKLDDDAFTLSALDCDLPVGFICVTPRALTYPLERLKDAFMEVLEVHENYRRQGIGRSLVQRGEEWASKEGFQQIRTHSNDGAADAIKMWNRLGFGLCPHDYRVGNEKHSGYWVAKPLSPLVPFLEKTADISRIANRWWGCVYDRYYGNDAEDVELLLDLLGPAPKKILEVCCGTGRVVVPLARAGHSVTGIDIDSGMLARLPAKAAGLPNLKYRLAERYVGHKRPVHHVKMQIIRPGALGQRHLLAQAQKIGRQDRRRELNHSVPSTFRSSPGTAWCSARSAPARSASPPPPAARRSSVPCGARTA